VEFFKSFSGREEQAVKKAIIKYKEFYRGNKKSPGTNLPARKANEKSVAAVRRISFSTFSITIRNMNMSYSHNNGELNDGHVKIARLKGKFTWHSHRFSNTIQKKIMKKFRITKNLRCDIFGIVIFPTADRFVIELKNL
jgi:hypothetical protein